MGDKPLSELQIELEELTRKHAELAPKAPSKEIQESEEGIRDE